MKTRKITLNHLVGNKSILSKENVPITNFRLDVHSLFGRN